MNRKFSLMSLLLVLALLPAFAADKKEKPGKPQVVDSGSFGVFVSGRRVATESFSIKKMADMSVTTSEIKAVDSKETQNSELELTPMGDLIRYHWKESGPEKGDTVVQPSEQFLIQKIRAGDKSTEQPYLMPASTAILDDYFFSHRELLLWRYIGGGCRPAQGETTCSLAQAKFGFIVPRQRSSGMATISYIGRESIDYHGTSQEMTKFTLASEIGTWVLWLDANQKLARIVVAGENIEIVRD